MLQIYNSKSLQKEIFEPITPGHIGLYICGITVYDHCHIGHARVFLAFDVIVRYLQYRGYQVRYIRNITDIDDKIIHRAEELGESIQDLTYRFIASMNEDLAALHVLTPTEEPRATLYMKEMVHMIENLIKKNYAYVGPNNDVYFRVRKFDTYGALSHKNIEDLASGSRVEINEAKEDPLDFVLWKQAKDHEPAWGAPWGKGRPGWHIECSAMSAACLGETFDIHGGGPDLKFPHHENERAQSEAVHGKRMVNYWMHAGFLQVNKQKMSKSLGNFFTIKDFLSQFDPEVLRYMIISSHYRSPIEYSDEHLTSAKLALDRFYIALKDIEKAERPLESGFEARFQQAMDDDFNTPEALAVLFDLVREINRNRELNMKLAAELAALLIYLGGVLGLLQRNPQEFLQGHGDIDEAKVAELIAARNRARSEKQWPEADRLRQKLTDMGVVLEDSNNGTVWRRI